MTHRGPILSPAVGRHAAPRPIHSLIPLLRFPSDSHPLWPIPPNAPLPPYTPSPHPHISTALQHGLGPTPDSNQAQHVHLLDLQPELPATPARFPIKQQPIISHHRHPTRDSTIQLRPSPGVRTGSGLGAQDRPICAPAPRRRARVVSCPSYDPTRTPTARTLRTLASLTGTNPEPARARTAAGCQHPTRNVASRWHGLTAHGTGHVAPTVIDVHGRLIHGARAESAQPVVIVLPPNAYAQRPASIARNLTLSAAALRLFKFKSILSYLIGEAEATVVPRVSAAGPLGISIRALAIQRSAVSVCGDVALSLFAGLASIPHYKADGQGANKGGRQKAKTKASIQYTNDTTHNNKVL
ncbi:hypothetical protein EVG20_g9511 [Dentipellis fragilis]|uniref:Uncharacterized protein n=1 Tax=Dentipellis fragilis TaxID=205917 RepID=A0A4Y9Y016_9AGAM|nr:hypothetical protein EVG20_g9511 [Dentipellis fragilis]